MLTETDIDELLERREGRDLDFKEGQYSFSGADETAKSELLKDILAFANTTRMHDAYILIGVREVKDGKSIPVGVTEHLDDASVQQFINSKTNRKVTFSYEPTPYSAISLGVIRIDRIQARPIWTTKRTGKVEEHKVYIRSGSSTAVATPDDIATIVTSAQSLIYRRPELSISIYSPETEACLKSTTTEKTYLRMPPDSEIDDYTDYIEGPFGTHRFNLPNVNRDFYRDGAKYYAQKSLIAPIHLCIENLGTGPAADLQVSLRFCATPDELTVLTSEEIKNKPESNSLINFSLPSTHRREQSLSIKRSNLGWSATFNVKKVLAQQRYVFEETIYLQSTVTSEIKIETSILADELSEQVTDELSVTFNVTTVDVSLEKLYAFMDR
ncbi:Divergent AAA domain protein [compost metagenome]